VINSYGVFSRTNSIITLTV